MNIKVVIVLILTVIAIIILTITSFNLSGTSGAVKHNPASLQPEILKDTLKVNTAQPDVIYHNKDKRENYYTVGFPKAWKTAAGKPGEYGFSFTDGNGSVYLMDVPDNTTLELYILSQSEPLLKKELKEYKKLDYQKVQINGIEAFQLRYQYKTDTGVMEGQNVYFTGADNAGVIIFKTTAAAYPALAETFTAIINTFKWELK
jgi:hypothetical protein